MENDIERVLCAIIRRLDELESKVVHLKESDVYILLTLAGLVDRQIAALTKESGHDERTN